MLRLAEAQIEQISAAVEQAHHELKTLRSQLVSKTAEFSPHRNGVHTTR
ncbi:hypothetical protein [Methylocystis sp.]|nr:hypothetical protein [Methylocystis sp.]